MRHFVHLWTSDLPFGGAPVEGALKVLGANDWDFTSISEAGWLMPEVKNHVKEQPTNKWKQYMIDRARGERT